MRPQPATPRVTTMEEAGTESLLTEKPRKAVSNTFGIAFAIIFSIGFGAALLYAGEANINKSCDRPLFDFLVGFGVTAIFSALVFLILEVTSKKQDDEDEGPKGIMFFLYYAVYILFFSFGITGAVYYFDSDDCDTLAAVAHRWTFAGVLAFFIVTFLILSALLGKFGGPVFAVFGFLLANLFQFLADLFRGLAEALNDDGDPENQPPKRTAAGDFALIINHTVVLWFFGYILWQAYEERDDPCDKPLNGNLVFFGCYGAFMAYCDYLYEKFAGVKTRTKLKTQFRFLWVVNILVYLVWGIETAIEVFESETCKETAKDTYRLAFLLSCIFFVFCGFLLLGICAGILDFLCSGRLRFVVVVETGPRDDEGGNY